MGHAFIDEYSLLHVATGIISYYWGVSLLLLVIMHSIFEYIENTEAGMSFIRKVSVWPGGKVGPDSIHNRIGDILFSVLGWLISMGIFALRTSE